MDLCLNYSIDFTRKVVPPKDIGIKICFSIFAYRKKKKKQNISREFDGLILICDYILINYYLGDMSVFIIIIIVVISDYSLHM